MITNQEALDQASEYLRSMPHRSRRKDFCAYRGDNGLKCAIGCLIPDEKYDPKMDGNGSINAVYRIFPSLHELFDKNQLSFLRDLQGVHDLPSNWSPKGFQGEGSLTALAAQYGLQYKPPKGA